MIYKIPLIAQGRESFVSCPAICYYLGTQLHIVQDDLLESHLVPLVVWTSHNKYLLGLPIQINYIKIELSFHWAPLAPMVVLVFFFWGGGVFPKFF